MQNTPEQNAPEEKKRRRLGKDYMMRSEKRETPSADTPGVPKKKKRRRRRRAGFFYVFFMLLFLLVLWPIGLIMLIRRKVRWRWTTKLLTAIVTLCLSITMIGFLLTVQTGDPVLTEKQDRVNDYLEHAGEYTIAAAKDAGAQIKQAWNVVLDITESTGRMSLRYLADGIEYSSTMADSLRAQLTGSDNEQTVTEPKDTLTIPLETTAGAPDTAAPTADTAESTASTDTQSAPAPAPTQTDPDETPDASAESTVQAEMTAVSTSEAAHVVEGAKSAPAVETDSANAVDEAEATDAVTETPTASAEATEVATEAPVVTADATEEAPVATEEVTTEPTVSTEPGEKATDAPAGTPDATLAATVQPAATDTAAPTEAPVIDTSAIRPYGEAPVYYTENGKYFHRRSSCSGMENASKHTLNEALENGKLRCHTCLDGHLPEEIGETDILLWADENDKTHLTNECEAFSGRWTLITPEDAIKADNTFCHKCDAAGWLVNSGLNAEQEEPTGEATEAAETVTPENVVFPAVPLKDAGEAIVYHSTNGKYYHGTSACQSMKHGHEYSFAECVREGYKWCRECGAPEPELLKTKCLWMDEHDICHTSDECSSFSGKYTLVARDEALEKGLQACPNCGAAEYLQPGTVLG